MIDNRPALKALRHVERNKIMEEVHLLDKVLPNMEIKDISKLNDTILACAKWNGNQLANQQPGWKKQPLK